MELAQLLEHVLRRLLCVAVQHGHIEHSVKLIVQPADGVPDHEIIPATVGIAHVDGLFISKPCFEEIHILEHISVSIRGGRTKDRFTATNVTLVPPMPPSLRTSCPSLS